MKEDNVILKNCRIRLHPHSQKITFGGVDLGPTTIVDKFSDTSFLLKRKGHMGWSGVGMTAYYPTEYYIIETEDSVIKKAYELSGIKITKKILSDFIQEYKNGKEEKF